MDKLSQALFLMRLKDIRRSGWVRSEIPYPESVAAHSYGAAALAILFADLFPRARREKILQMAVLHDLGEAATMKDAVADRWREINLKKRKEKAEKELNALPRFVDKKFVSLYREMEEGKTPESRTVKELDKLDMALTAFIYEERTGKDLREFFESADVQIKSPGIRRIFKQLLVSRGKPAPGRGRRRGARAR